MRTCERCPDRAWRDWLCTHHYDIRQQINKVEKGLRESCATYGFGHKYTVGLRARLRQLSDENNTRAPVDV